MFHEWQLSLADHTHLYSSELHANCSRGCKKPTTWKKPVTGTSGSTCHKHDGFFTDLLQRRALRQTALMLVKNVHSQFLRNLKYSKELVPNLGVNYPNCEIGRFDFGNGLFVFC